MLRAKRHDEQRHRPAQSPLTFIAVALALSLGAFPVTAQTSTEGLAELIDLDNLGRTDPDIVRLMTYEPRPWPGIRGPQPFNQVPPQAQQDFRPPPQTVTPPSPPPSTPPPGTTPPPGIR